MKETNEKSLQLTTKSGIFSKFVRFIKRLFNINNINYMKNSREENNLATINSFLKDIKFEKDPENEILLNIQDELEKVGINKENAYKITKNLSDEQKIKLLNLYKEQIKIYEQRIEDHKNRIIAIRKKIV